MPNIINADNGLVSGSVGLKYSCDNTGVLALQTSGNTAMTIDGSGNVGIGLTSPTSRLTVRTADGDGIAIQNAAGTSYRWTVNADNSFSCVNTGVAERMRIDSSGNVSIGTTSSSGQAFRVSQTSFPNVPSGWYANAGDGNSEQYGITRVDATNGRGIRFQTTLDGSNLPYYTISTGTAASTIAGMTWTERMRITSGGQLLVGTTTGTTLSSVAWNTTLSGGGNNLAVVNTSTNGSTTSGFQASNYTVSGANIINFYNGSGSLAGVISVPTNGSTGTTVNYGTSSDYRMKENIAPMIGALNKVLQLNPVTYTWKSNGYAGQGFIAHELQEIVPDCVTGEKDAVDAEGKPVYQGVDTSFLVATLTAAIQEQQQIITDLKARIETLEAKV